MNLSYSPYLTPLRNYLPHNPLEDHEHSLSLSLPLSLTPLINSLPATLLLKITAPAVK
jgi:hypothetical protein